MKVTTCMYDMFMYGQLVVTMATAAYLDVLPAASVAWQTRRRATRQSPLAAAAASSSVEVSASAFAKQTIYLIKTLK